MTYQQTLQYLYSQLPMFHRIGAAAYKADLANTIELSRLMANPEQQFRSVHIAGTNGKGSTSHFLASILQEAGYCTGLFTSPHLKDFRERIRINGRMIPKQDVTNFVQKYENSFSQIKPSFFEWSFALAIHHFAKHHIDVAIMETGMGGRLDSTNIIHPVLSIITNIGLDHMQFLGDTREKIAKEKAGIIKNGVPVVVGETQPGLSEIFREYSSNMSAPIIFADQNYSILSSGWTRHRIPLLWINARNKAILTDQMILSSLNGIYQSKNILTVLQAVETLNSSGFNISTQHIHQGFRKVITNTQLKGRWQTLAHSPKTIADIAHNMDGIREVVKQINITKFEKLHMVIGVVKDKDVNAMLKLLPKTASYYFCKADIPRGMDAEELMETAASFGLIGNYFPTVQRALMTAKNAAGSNDMIFIGGSAFVVAEVI
jgi:dihydrofolate synthase / folylpolyglutamate synthase